MPYIIGLVFGVFVFILVLYHVVKAAVNNSEILREIRVSLMKAQNEKDYRD